MDEETFNSLMNDFDESCRSGSISGIDVKLKQICTELEQSCSDDLDLRSQREFKSWCLPKFKSNPEINQTDGLSTAYRAYRNCLIECGFLESSSEGNQEKCEHFLRKIEHWQPRHFGFYCRFASVDEIKLKLVDSVKKDKQNWIEHGLWHSANAGKFDVVQFFYKKRADLKSNVGHYKRFNCTNVFKLIT